MGAAVSPLDEDGLAGRASVLNPDVSCSIQLRTIKPCSLNYETVPTVCTVPTVI